MLFQQAKKCMSLVLVLVLAIGLLAGCAKGTKEEKTGSNNAATDSITQPESSEPVEISMFLPSRLPEAIYDKDTMTFKTLAEKLNLKLDIESVVQSEAKQKFRVIVSSGDYPDVMAGTVSDVNTFGMSGAFMPLDDLIDQYAPNIKKYLVENKEAMAQCVGSDGKIYGIPMLSAIRTAMGYNIRMDWLKKLNLEVPVTIDDWHNVLTAFKTNDLNGHGAGDVTPLIFDRAWENYFMNFADAWGIELNGNNDYWMIKDGEVAFAPILPETKEFLATMAKWYKEGLIDSEFITREDTNNYHILNNKAGATCYWTGYIAGQNINSEVLKNDPNTNWQVIQPPVLKEGQDPKTYSQQSAIVGFSWAISSSAKNAEDIIKMFDYVYSDEGSLLFNFGIEGDSYEMVNGVPQYTDKVNNSEGGRVNWLRANGLQALIGIRQMPEYEAASCANEDVKAQLFNYIDKDYFYPYNPTLTLTAAEQEIYDIKMSAVKTYVDEELLKFFIGSRPIGEFDDFVSRVKELGIDEMTTLKKQAYDRYKSVAE
ncbi:extracellular solute-binding protein [Anaerocolumna xylanovorans]|uniref:Putative aldouronate transport system substrate-binding protein n=1 Tax=Anaerocolumna xylanovorans DSM 12503 TaxID=1121345 RepID=A0A1M7YK05_9FIRM|nr:extracellular solute-binding protein [Anaerocolumna xylanovorans]SHO52916.1 putative aldouronate transport system substrate-binding protein [Anaerocolumna xylanovorans DSM 12503]